MENSVFFPQEMLDQWAILGTAELRPGELLLLKEGRRYGVEEAVLVVREVTGSPDPHDLTGKVKPISVLAELGAEILEGSMIIGDNAYDVVAGWAGRPIEAFEEYLGSPARKIAKRASGTAADPDPSSDEDLLSRLAAPTM